MQNNSSENVLILHDIRSVENVGAMFRTADAAGIHKIYLCGYTPGPLDRFGRKRKDIHKSALGAEEFVASEHVPDVFQLLADLKQNGFQVIAIEQDETSVDYKNVLLKQKNAFIVGTEVTGIPKEILKECDVIAEIPMKGKKESLNVSVATGVAMFRILNI